MIKIVGFKDKITFAVRTISLYAGINALARPLPYNIWRTTIDFNSELLSKKLRENSRLSMGKLLEILLGAVVLGQSKSKKTFE